MSALPKHQPFQNAGQRLHWDPLRFRAISMQPIHADDDSTGTSTLPEPGPWATQIARASIECLLGLRPPHQLVRWLAPPVYESLTARVGAVARHKYAAKSRAVRVREALINPVDERTLEASCTVYDGDRFRACAMRLREFRGRWLVVALEIG